MLQAIDEDRTMIVVVGDDPATKSEVSIRHAEQQNPQQLRVGILYGYERDRDRHP
jgi:hypothetical protein